MGTNLDLIKKMHIILNDSNENNIINFFDESLPKLSNKEKLTILFEALDSKNWNIRKYAHESIHKIGPEIIKDLDSAIRATDNENKIYWGIKTLGKFSTAALNELLIYISENDNDNYVLFAISNLPDIDNIKIIDTIINLFTHKTWLIRKEAANTLINKQVGVQTVIKRIFENFDVKESDKAFWSMKVLGQLLKESAIEKFQKFLNSNNSEMKFLALHGLAEIKSEKLLPILLNFLKDPSWEVRNQASIMLASYGNIAIDFLEKKAKEGDNEALTWIPKILYTVLDGTTAVTINNFFGKGTSELRLNALEVISSIKNSKNIEILINYLSNNNWMVRKQASDTLIKMGDIAVKRLSKKLLESTVSDDENYWLIRTLGKIGGKAIETIKYIMNNKDVQIRRFAINAISDIDSDEVIEILLDCFSDESWPIRNSASLILKSAGIKVIPNIYIKLLSKSDDIIYWCTHTIKQIKQKNYYKLAKIFPELPLNQKEAVIINLKRMEIDKLLELDELSFEEFRSNLTKIVTDKREIQDFSNINSVFLDFTVSQLLIRLHEEGGSDLHLNIGSKPVIRIDGHLKEIEGPILTPELNKKLIKKIINPNLEKKLEEEKAIDFSYEIPNIARFRVNIYEVMRGYNAVFRLIPNILPSLNDLKLPSIISKFAEYENGLILITGQTGSGKTTTMASIVNIINHKSNKHIITIEDPIEYIHERKSSIVSQREIGQSAISFAGSLKSALREDPDVILIGELRDYETINLALTASNTGHLVISTLHTSDAIQTIDRLLSVFPSEQINQVRTQIANSLKAVVSQKLLPKIGGGRVPICEILINNSAVSNLIREGKTSQILSILQTNKEAGMQNYDKELLFALKNGIIDEKTAILHATDVKSFKS